MREIVYNSGIFQEVICHIWSILTTIYVSFRSSFQIHSMYFQTTFCSNEGQVSSIFGLLYVKYNSICPSIKTLQINHHFVWVSQWHRLACKFLSNQNCFCMLGKWESRYDGIRQWPQCWQPRNIHCCEIGASCWGYRFWHPSPMQPLGSPHCKTGCTQKQKNCCSWRILLQRYKTKDTDFRDPENQKQPARNGFLEPS